MKLIIAKAILALCCTPIIYLILCAIWRDIKTITKQEAISILLTISLAAIIVWAIMTVLGV